ncbi:hypothetical protein [Methylobacterium sp. A54F]
MLDRWADLPHTAALNHGLDLAREVTGVVGITITDEHLVLLSAAILCGYAAAGGLEEAPRQSLKQAADRWSELGGADV